MDYRPEKLKILLKRLEGGMLEREDAIDLMDLLKEELSKAKKNGDVDREADISVLMDILYSYIKGIIDLRAREFKIHTT